MPDLDLNDTDQLKFEKDLEEDHLVIIESAKEMFKANKRHINNLVSAQKQSLEQRKEEIRQIQARIKKNQENLILLREQISISDDLLRSNLTNKAMPLAPITIANEIINTT